MTKEYYSLGGTKIPESEFNPAKNPLLYDPATGKYGVYVDKNTVPKDFTVPDEIVEYPVILVTSSKYAEIEETIHPRGRFYPALWKDIKMKSIIARLDRWGREG